ncbi:MAG: signal peptidase I [Planctomycetes bacterium]|nr:signal peptidase I [Planctomycetota bacterium]
MLPPESPVDPSSPSPADPEPSVPKPRRRPAAAVFEVATTVLLAVLLALVLRSFVAQAYEVNGRSMEPTFHDGEKVMVHKLSPGIFPIHRGDIIIFASPTDPGRDLIKRVIAVGGDDVRLRGGRVYVNGEEVHEDYAYADRGYARDFRDHVPEGHYFVLGDNRAISLDSRRFHAIPASLVKGKVFLRWWPLSQLRAFD